MRTVALDVDLHRIHAWDSVTGAICTSAPDLGPVIRHLAYRDGEPILVLQEIASPVSAARKDAAASATAYNLMKWAIFNVAAATRLNVWRNGELLVAPSSKWTRGYSREVRHKLAACTGKNKDLREAQAMIFFHARYPDAWIPLNAYLETL